VLKLTDMKKSILYSVIALATAGFFACSSNTNKDTAHEAGTPESAEQHNDAKFNNDNESDAQFVVDAAQDNLLGISLCDLAMSRSTHPEVKELAKNLSDHHTKAQNELAALAQTKNITIPTSHDPEAAEYKSLNDKSGTDFEKSYYNKVVDMHKDAISRYEKAAQDSKDADIRNWASAQLPTLRAHLDRAMDDQKLADNWK
jgi:putative membrane protein